MSHREIAVYKWESSDGDGPPEKVIEFVAWLGGLIGKIPAEFRDTATIEIDSTGGYDDSHYATVKVAYVRPITMEDMNAMQARLDAAVKVKDDADRAEYERLKKRFGEQP